MPIQGREDRHTWGFRHEAIGATADEVCRNASLAAWMIRRHLDYVASFQFRARTGDQTLDQELEGMMELRSRPNAFDVAGRFGREKMFRMAEARRVRDGDTILVKLTDGRVQGVRADLLMNPKDSETTPRPDEQRPWINGVQIDRVGRPLRFGIYERRGMSGREYHRTLRSRNVMFYGFWDNYAADQVRGVSPMVTALAPLQDVYEGFNYALAKSKLSQLLAIAFYRENADPLGEIDKVYASTGADSSDTAKPREYKVSFGGGPKVFNLDPGDRAEFLESKNPSTEFQAFSELVIQVALKALDIPYSFYDEAHTNFFGSRAAWLHYERSCMDKRADQIELRRQYTVWQLALAIKSRSLRLPRSMSINDLKFEWVPLGMPWWDPTKEIKGHVAAIENGLDNPQRICRSTGTDYYDNIDAIAEASTYAASKGVPVSFATPSRPEDPPENEPVEPEDPDQ